MPSSTQYIGTISSTALSYAKDYLTGSDYDYVFYQYSENQYYLIMSEHLIIEDGSFYSDTVSDLVVLTYDPRDYSNPYDDPSNWKASFSNIAAGYVFTPYTDQLFYSSVGVNPRLRNGGEFYAFSTNALLVIGFLFMLVSRIFRRLV